MWVKEPDSNKRNNERIDRSFAISMLPGQDGETNVEFSKVVYICCLFSITLLPYVVVFSKSWL